MIIMICVFQRHVLLSFLLTTKGLNTILLLKTTPLNIRFGGMLINNNHKYDYSLRFHLSNKLRVAQLYKCQLDITNSNQYNLTYVSLTTTATVTVTTITHQYD